ncbi:MAG TPA: DMT family transporter [Candidatus Limnocylindria bacterium]|nr:DMT family transporter [Candidatus Limnocylindria bacterium]
MIRDLPAAIARRPRLAALLGAFCIAFSGIFYLYAEVTSETATVFRALYGLPILLVAALLERRRLGPLPRRAQKLAVLAGAFFAADLLFWHHSIDAVGAGLATVLGNLQVVVVAIAAWLLFGERPSARTLAGIPVILAGVVLISGVVGADAYGSDPPLGVVLGILTALAYGAYLIVIRQAGRGRPAEPVAISTASTAAVAIVVGVLVGRLDPLPSWPAHGWLILLGVSAQSVGYLLISLSLPRLPAVVTSIILLAQPVMAVFLAMILLSEAPSITQLAGVGLVIGGIALATLPLRGLLRRALPSGP